MQVQTTSPASLPACSGSGFTGLDARSSASAPNAQGSREAVHLYETFKKNDQPIEGGYGEYVVYDQKHPERDLDQLIFELAYWKIDQYTKDRSLSAKVRLERLRDEVAIIGPSLKIAFIPRTLYELIFIRASIEEEMSQTSICPFPEKGASVLLCRWLQIGKKDVKEIVENKLAHCWHIACEKSEVLRDQSSKMPIDNQHPLVRRLAYRMNDLLIKTLKPAGNFTGRQIAQFVEKELDYLAMHYETFPKHYPYGDFERSIPDRITPGRLGAAINFGLEEGGGDYYYCYPMGIKDSHDSNLACAATALECQLISQNAFILYRVDSYPVCSSAKTEEKDLGKESVFASEVYGTSLFARGLATGCASVFHDSKNKYRTTYATIVPYEEYASSPFHLLAVNAICQMSGVTDFYMAQAKVPRAWATDGVDSVTPDERDQIKELLTDKSAVELRAQLDEYRSKAVLLSLPRERSSETFRNFLHVSSPPARILYHKAKQVEQDPSHL